MVDPTAFDLIALDAVIETYDYETDPVLNAHFRGVEERLWSRIESYGAGINAYGTGLAAHLRRSSRDGMAFLSGGLGFSEKAGRNFHAANLFQDLGKTHPSFDPNIWTLPHRPTEAERTQKRGHIEYGVEMLEDALKGLPSEVLDHPHIRIVIPAIQLFHHERADGAGPYGRTSADMGRVIRAASIVDTKDGDMMRRPHQPFARSEAETLLRMKGLPGFDKDRKYAGAFDTLLDDYIAYRERVTGQSIIPVNRSAAS